MRSLLTTREVAERFAVSPETVLRWWRRGELPGFRLGATALRFDPVELDAFLASCRHSCKHDHLGVVSKRVHSDDHEPR
jgi:excisionase family DNA binding protein